MAKKITDTQILRCIKTHEATAYHRRENGRVALAKSIRYVLNGGSPYDSIRGANSDTPKFLSHDVIMAAQNSDHPFMAGYEYVGFLADELLYNAGLVNTDIEDYLNEKGISHGSQGRRWLAETLAAHLSAPLWHEPNLTEMAGMLTQKYGRVIRFNDLAQSLRVAIRCERSEVNTWLIMAKRELTGMDDRKPRGYMGRIHNTMLSMGFSVLDEGFEHLRFAVWTVIRSGKKDRRLFIKDVLPVVAQKYKKPESAIKSAIDNAICHAAVGGAFSEVLFRIVNVLEPQNDPLYQLADEVLHEHGLGHRQKLRGYECLRVAMVKLTENRGLFDGGIQKTLVAVDAELGYQGWNYATEGHHYHARCSCLMRWAVKPSKEFQATGGDLWSFVKQMANALIAKQELLQMQAA